MGIRRGLKMDEDLSHKIARNIIQHLNDSYLSPVFIHLISTEDIAKIIDKEIRPLEIKIEKFKEFVQDLPFDNI
jgi:hypothetical protein